MTIRRRLVAALLTIPAAVLVTGGMRSASANAASTPSATTWHVTGATHYPRKENNTGDHGVRVYEEAKDGDPSVVRWCVANHHSAGAVQEPGITYAEYVLGKETDYPSTFPAHESTRCYPDGGFTYSSARDLRVFLVYRLIGGSDLYEIDCRVSSGCKR